MPKPPAAPMAGAPRTTISLIAGRHVLVAVIADDLENQREDPLVNHLDLVVFPPNGAGHACSLITGSGLETMACDVYYANRLNKKPSKRRANTTFEPTSHLSTSRRIDGIGTYLGIGYQASGIRFRDRSQCLIPD